MGAREKRRGEGYQIAVRGEIKEGTGAVSGKCYADPSSFTRMDGTDSGLFVPW